MPVNFYLGRSDSIIIRPMYLCGHTYATKVSRDTHAAQRCLIEADCAEIPCPVCRAKEQRAQTNAKRKR